MDNIQNKVYNKIGLLDEKSYFFVIGELSQDLVEYKIAEELGLYYVSHNEEILSEEAQKYILDNLNAFIDVKKIVDNGGDLNG